MIRQRVMAWGIIIVLSLTGFINTKTVSLQEEPRETVILTQEMAQEEPLRFFIGVVAEKQVESMSYFVDLFKGCCQWSGCFAPEVHYLAEEPHKKSDVQNLFKNSYDCAVFLSGNPASGSVEWRLYDTALGHMIKGKKQAVVDGDSQTQKLLAYRSAGAVIEELVHEPQPFFSQIAYRKKDRKSKKYDLVIADFDGSRPRSILTSSRILVSLQWNKDPEYPVLFFSEFTPHNVCLKMTDMSGRVLTILDADGTTAGVSCSAFSDTVVYCHSGDIWKYEYDKKNKKSLHTRIIHEKGISSSPVLLDNGDVIYSHKGLIKQYHAKTGASSIIVDRGYCVSPAYSSTANKLAYAKRVNGLMQLFVYDLKTGVHEQVTSENKNASSDDYRSDKTEVCWSPDGRYLLFTWERKNTSRIGLLNLATKKYSFITPENEHCSYPAWS